MKIDLSIIIFSGIFFFGCVENGSTSGLLPQVDSISSVVNTRIPVNMWAIDMTPLEINGIEYSIGRQSYIL